MRRIFPTHGRMVLGLALISVVLTGTVSPVMTSLGDSMQPNMQPGDVLIYTETGWYPEPNDIKDTGIVTVHQSKAGETHRAGGQHGDVIIFTIEGSSFPTVHRAYYWVEEGENWADDVDPKYTANASCEAIANCPAPNAGFITKGDNHEYYDQSVGYSKPVPLDAIIGKVEFVLRGPDLLD